MDKLTFVLILLGTLYAPCELTRCIIAEIPEAVNFGLVGNLRLELGMMWSWYIAAMIILRLTLLRLKR